jgi:hypothetical protein
LKEKFFMYSSLNISPRRLHRLLSFGIIASMLLSIFPILSPTQTAHAGSITLIPTNSSWFYNNSGNDLGVNWFNIDPVANGWSTGNGILGFGSLDGTTPDTIITNHNGGTSGNSATYYFQSTFNITNPNAFFSLVAHVLSDDGMVLYVNGNEVCRDGMPAGAVAYNTLASNASPENAYNFACNIPTTFLIAGVNEIDVEVHQTTLGSSDIGFDLFVEAVSVEINEHICYTVGDNGGNSDPDDLVGMVINLDTNTVSATTIRTDIFAGEPTSVDDIESAEYDPITQQILAGGYTNGGHQLVQLDPTNGDFTVIGPFGIMTDGISNTVSINDVDGMAYDVVRDIWYGTVRRGASGDYDVLFAFNPNTGAFIPSFFPDTNGSNGGDDYILLDGSLDDVDDLAIDPLTGLLYGIFNVGSGSATSVFTIDPQIGRSSLTEFQTLQMGGDDLIDVEGLTLDPQTGRVYVTTGSGGTPGAGEVNQPNSIFLVDLSTVVNSTATLLADLSSYSTDFESFSCHTRFSTPEPVGAIGNYVWFDENGDGIQDAGEDGIPGAVVTLEISNGSIITTTTDANGGYIFPNLPIHQTYTVTVSSLPTGLHQTFDEDGLGTPHQIVINGLDGGEEHLTADFGYNWVPPVDSSNPIAGTTGAIGDRIWIDANGDGVQDAGEVGIAGVTVTLYYDADGDGVADEVYGATTTDEHGSYIFDDLPPGIYNVEVTPPSGYTQTGDPDEYGLPATNPDNATTTTIILAPGDVILNVDFGYEPNAGTFGSIGDTIYLDLDGNGIQDGSDSGIAGVTVALYDENVNVIATTTTDANGNYNFPGLPLAVDYTVVVTDTNNVLGGLAQTGDPDGGNDGQSTVSSLSGDDPDQDFGYQPVNRDHGGTGIIGDTIFLDTDGDGQPDSGEGVEGVTVYLYDSNGAIIDIAITDENGNYVFTNLPADTYTVQVNTSTLPNGGIGWTNTIDPDTANPGDSQSTIVLADGEINLDQDFGYEGTGRIGNLIWADINADGDLDAGENGIGGVTINLLDRDGNIVATTTTAPDGSYLFDNLPPGDYTVDVTDVYNVLAGYWHSYGTPATDNNSQSDTYDVTLGLGDNHVAADFGYYVLPGGLGNYVWADHNSDGIQDGNEPGIPGVTMTMTITYPSGDIVVLTTVTDANGMYSFDNLLLDETFNGDTGDGSGEPTFEITVLGPVGFDPSPQGTTTDDNDSDDPTGQMATTTQGGYNPDYDFGYEAVTVAIGNRVWQETDGDNTSFGEPGIGGVTVHLYAAGATPGTVQPIATATTASDGTYLFTNVPAGDYFVAVDESSLPVDITGSVVGGNHAPDATGDDNTPNGDDGMSNGNGYTVSQVFTVTVGGQNPANDVAADDVSTYYPDNSAYLTIDFGFVGVGGPTALSMASMNVVQEDSNAIFFVVLALMLGLATTFVVDRQRRVEMVG